MIIIVLLPKKGFGILSAVHLWYSVCRAPSGAKIYFTWLWSSCNNLNVLTSTESTAGKSLLQLTASPVSCFHTSPGRAKTCKIWHRRSQKVKSLSPTDSYFIAVTDLQKVKSEHHSLRSLFLWEQLPWADRSTHTCGTLYRTGWGRSNLWPLMHPDRPAKVR